MAVIAYFLAGIDRSKFETCLPWKEGAKEGREERALNFRTLSVCEGREKLEDLVENLVELLKPI